MRVDDPQSQKQTQMSAFGGKADVLRTPPKSPLIAKSGHYTLVRAVYDLSLDRQEEPLTLTRCQFARPRSLGLHLGYFDAGALGRRFRFRWFADLAVDQPRDRLSNVWIDGLVADFREFCL